MSKSHLEKSPGVAAAEQGQVILDGPDGVAIAMSPKAAVGTAKSLLAAAEEAEGQSTEPSEDPS